MSFLNVIITLVLLRYGIQEEEKIKYNETCRFTGAKPVNPFPNLAKCYKYNEAACCTVLHDDFIRDYTQEIIPNACLRKYPELEDLLCLACHPLESVYARNGVIYICKSFAMKLWGVDNEEGLNNITTRFDNCGLLKSDHIIVTDEDARNPNNFSFIIPSTFFFNFSDFIESIGIPYYQKKDDTYHINYSLDDPLYCFNSENNIKPMMVNMFLFIFLFF